MKAAINLACILAFIATCSARAVEDTKEDGEVVETPPPWAISTKPKEESLVRVGCFKDNYHSRALPQLVANFRLSKSFDWSNMAAVVSGCAEAAKSKGYKWFGVQFYGECWSGPSASTTYNKYGPAENCWNGVGEHWTNMVYKIE